MESAKSSKRPYMTPSLFKDYNKATKDILTKNYTADGMWKVECKHKAPVNTFVFNPVAEFAPKKQGITCDIEYTHEHGGSVKVNVAPELLKNLKTTASYTHEGHKFEGVMHLKDDKVLYELSHQTSVLLQKRASLNEKLTQEVVELGLGVDVAPRCQIGAGAVYSIKKRSCDWNLGCRYFNTHACEMAITTNKLKTFTTSASGPLNFSVGSRDVKLFVAAETVCGQKRPLDGKLGVEAKCLLVPANVLKARSRAQQEVGRQLHHEPPQQLVRRHHG
ncbi:hypothetical protein STCU_01810 [Strigomonas culicis]|uniref:Voltage-dependent anion-selective channel n=1 Tax=Strigomonas culicis TaxID=28005 RepID=S9W492_9TRYP|nr:hypothetical protein STCU_01810 [Strigomonas culicis]|eukprot:EPY34161.1 hypothetical protein STCU_01810 [Strigomonas culicis]